MGKEFLRERKLVTFAATPAAGEVDDGTKVTLLKGKWAMNLPMKLFLVYSSNIADIAKTHLYTTVGGQHLEITSLATKSVTGKLVSYQLTNYPIDAIIVGVDALSTNGKVYVEFLGSNS